LSVLEGLGWKARQAIFLGHSLGAAVALQLALEKPPAALVLESPFSTRVLLAEEFCFSCFSSTTNLSVEGKAITGYNLCFCCLFS
jgi:pimeloyl-ACP methyl ester carboxylesterase